jgi:hypothetical protein
VAEHLGSNGVSQSRPPLFIVPVFHCPDRACSGLTGGTRAGIRGVPGLVIVSWTPCGCAGGDGHLRVRCAERGCRSVWYQPPHVPGTEVAGAYTPPRLALPPPGGIGGSWL